MTQIFTIQNDKVVISKLSLSEIEGPIHTSETLRINGDVEVAGLLAVSDIITNTIKVNSIITDSGPLVDIGNWSFNTEEELIDKGFFWKSKNDSAQLVYKSNKTLWTNANIELSPESAYKINNVSVLTSNTLGSTVVRSNLRQVGPLNQLTVIGDASIGEFFFMNSTHGRIGIGTENPNAALDIVENNVEMTIGSPSPGIGSIGTFSNHELVITTDNTPRITVTPAGEVIIGSQTNKSSCLRVYGTLYAESIISDTRITRSTSLEFTNDENNSIYNKGIVWISNNGSKYLTLSNNPDRIYSSESIDIALNKSYSIGGSTVLTSDALGEQIIHSHLQSVGELSSLTVLGNSTMNSMSIGQLSITQNGMTFENSLNLLVGNQPIMYANTNQITFGTPSDTVMAKVQGKLSVGITNPDPTVDLAVKGNISFANKKFITGTEIPTTGIFMKGDICWNQNPSEQSFVGWICIVSGEPGVWRPFGSIFN